MIKAVIPPKPSAPLLKRSPRRVDGHHGPSASAPWGLSAGRKRRGRTRRSVSCSRRNDIARLRASGEGLTSSASVYEEPKSKPDGS